MLRTNSAIVLAVVAAMFVTGHAHAARRAAPGGVLVAVDSKGKVLGQVIEADSPTADTSGPPATVVMQVKGKTIAMRMNYYGIANWRNLYFTEPNCAGNAYYYNEVFDDPKSRYLLDMAIVSGRNATVFFLSGNSVAAKDVVVRSVQLGTNSSADSNLVYCSNDVDPSQLQSGYMMPFAPAFDLYSVYKPPFTVKFISSSR
ncbi:MAG: hypothetical protein PHT19_12920 [Methylococcus sp.]|nr:hypothetical protein [Methylococcus sp.]